MISAGNDGTVAIWPIFAHPVAPERRLTNGTPVSALSQSPDGRFLLAGGANGLVQLWNLQLLERPSISVLHRSQVLAAAFTPDGRIAATGSQDGTVRVWSTRTGEEVCPPLHHFGYIAAIAFSQDGRRLLVGSADRSAVIWSIATGEPLVRMLHGDYVNDLAFSPDDRLVATASEEGLRLWDAATGEPVSPFIAAADGFPQARRVKFFPDGEHILWCSQYASNARISRLPKESHGVQYWLDLAAVTSGQYVTASGNLEAVPTAELIAAHARLQSSRMPSTR